MGKKKKQKEPYPDHYQIDVCDRRNHHIDSRTDKGSQVTEGRKSLQTNYTPSKEI